MVCGARFDSMVRNFFEMFLRARRALEFSHSQDPTRTLTALKFRSAAGPERRGVNGFVNRRSPLTRSVLNPGPNKSQRKACHRANVRCAWTVIILRTTDSRGPPSIRRCHLRYRRMNPPARSASDILPFCNRADALRVSAAAHHAGWVMTCHSSRRRGFVCGCRASMRSMLS